MMTYDGLIDFVDEDQLSKKLVFLGGFHALRSIYREKITARIIGWTNVSQAMYNIILIPIWYKK